MTILFVAPWYPIKSTHNGIFIKRHAQAIALKHKVVVLHIYADNASKIEINKDGNFNEIVVSYKKPANRIFKFFNSFNILQSTFEKAYGVVLKEFEKPQIIHHNIVFPQGVFSKKLSEKYNIPLIVSEQWSGYLPEDNSYNKFVIKYFSKKVFARASATTAVSQALGNAIRGKRLATEISVIPNVIDLNLFVLPTLETINLVPQILHVSSLNDNEKNISLLLKSMQIVHSKGIDFQLNIVGDSVEKTYFKSLVIELNIEHKVKFLGAKTPVELADIYQQNNLFALTSNYETFCVVLIEALACGLPIVARNVGAVNEIVNNNTGILVNSAEPEEFANAIIKMLAQYKTYNKTNLRNVVESRFTPEIVVEKFTQLYESVIRK